jgi:hypothetical protein
MDFGSPLDIDNRDHDSIVSHKMPPISVCKDAIRAYMLLMITRSIFTPFSSLEEACQQFDLDIATILSIEQTRYLNPRYPIPKAGNIHLAWEYAQNPANHHCFISMLRVSPLVFETILTLIQDHPIFTNQSNLGQTPVEQQLGVTLFRMGRYGNGAAVEDVARIAGCSEGSVENYTDRCFTAIEGLYDLFIRKLTPAEKAVEKAWIDEHLGFKGLWREGWLMYDGTIVVLFHKPGLNGDAYYTRKSNYGLNVQVSVQSSGLSFYSMKLASDWEYTLKSSHCRLLSWTYRIRA